MKNLKLKTFIENSNINAGLIRATVKQAGGWSYFKDIAENVTGHGAAGGFCGFTYYVDTLKFTRNNKKLILDLCAEMDQQIENIGLLGFIASFNCLNDINQDSIARAIYTGKGDDVTQVLNALAWFSLEEVARSFYDFSENENN